jgi:hypothetical protein
MLKISFTFSTKQATLLRSSLVLNIPFQFVFPAGSIPWSLRQKQTILLPGKSYRRGRRFSTVDLLVLTGFDQLRFIMKISFALSTKQATLMRSSLVLNLPFQLVFPVLKPQTETNWSFTFMLVMMFLRWRSGSNWCRSSNVATLLYDPTLPSTLTTPTRSDAIDFWLLLLHFVVQV